MVKRNKGLVSIITGTLAVLTVLGALTYNSVYAQSPTPTPSAPDSAAPSATAPGAAAPGAAAPGTAGKGFRGGPGARVTEDDLAAALGITTAQLQTAQETANAEAIKEAVAKGLITQAQADQMTANGAGMRGLGHFAKPGAAAADSIDYDALLAKALNITTEQLQAARQTAFNTSLDAAVTAGTLTQAQADEMKGMQALANDAKFQSTLQTAFESGVKQAVTDGVITQTQADAILASQNGNRFGAFGHGFELGGPGGHGGRGMRGGFGLDGSTPAIPDTQNN